MDYKIRREKEELESTGFIEIGPGRCTGKHWQDGCLFIWEDSFGMAEGIILKHFKDYDHMSENEIPKQTMMNIIREWKTAATLISKEDLENSWKILNGHQMYAAYLKDELKENIEQIKEMLIELAAECESFCRNDKWIFVLGV